jgi:hypothetical protein
MTGGDQSASTVRLLSHLLKRPGSPDGQQTLNTAANNGNLIRYRVKAFYGVLVRRSLALSHSAFVIEMV